VTQPFDDDASGELVEGELLTSADSMWVGHLVMEGVRTIALVVIAIALVVIA
jgi:hypothetical protein